MSAAIAMSAAAPEPMTLSFVLPWPPAALSPNNNPHWAVRARAKRSYRSACAWTARAQGAKRLSAEALALRIVFVPPCRRARDLDNCVAAMKAGFDGLADVLGVDDSRWRWEPAPIIAVGEIGGFVRVGVTACRA